MHEDDADTEPLAETLGRIESALSRIAAHGGAPARRGAASAPVSADLAAALDDIIARLRAALSPEPE